MASFPIYFFIITILGKISENYKTKLKKVGHLEKSILKLESLTLVKSMKTQNMISEL